MKDIRSTAYLAIKTPEEYEKIALQTFEHQYASNPVYRSFCTLIHRAPADIHHSIDIPALPIGFFKSHRVTSFDHTPEITFTSSGTTAQRTAQHHLVSTKQYRHTFLTIFEQHYGQPNRWTILALLPAYLERQGSSLVYMMDHLIKKSKHPQSGFYLNDFKSLNATLQVLEEKKQPTLLLGVSFALIDFAEQYPQQLNSTIVMETGGMKGRREEITREALHSILSAGFGVTDIHSEYGMTELLSQAYSKGNGRFFPPPWMRVRAMEINDPFACAGNNKIGRLNIQDLANYHSCAFLATDDLGRTHADGSFEILGRMDTSDIRGCNLMVV